MKPLLAMVALLSLLSVAIAADINNCMAVDISDSSYSIYDAGNLFADANSIADSLLDEEFIGDPQLEILAKDLDSHAVLKAEDYEIDLNCDATGIAHISWLSKTSTPDNLTVITSLSTFVQVWGNSTQGAISSDGTILTQNMSNSMATLTQNSIADPISADSKASVSQSNTETVIKDKPNSQVITAQDSVADAINTNSASPANAGTGTTISDTPDTSDTTEIADPSSPASTADTQSDISANATAP